MQYMLLWLATDNLPSFIFPELNEITIISGFLKWSTTNYLYFIKILQSLEIKNKNK